MTIALLAVGLDPGIGIFHADVDRKSSLALDAIEAVRPYVDCWLLSYLAASVFANRDFTEISDGEVRIAPPLNSHLAHSAALWRKACELVADWLANAIGQAVDTGAVLTANDRIIPQHMPARLREQPCPVAVLAPPLPNFFAPLRGHRPLSPRGGLKENPVPRTCHECGRALDTRQRKFCSHDCAISFHTATTGEPLSAAGSAALAAPAAAGLNAGSDGEVVRGLAEKNRRHIVERRGWDARHTPGEGLTQTGPRRPTATQARLRRWYAAKLQPRIVALRNPEIAQATGLSIRYAIMIRQGFVPHPRHFGALAKLAGVRLPEGLPPSPETPQPPEPVQAPAALPG
jgi:hypothetical protein